MPFNIGTPELLFLVVLIGIGAIIWRAVREATSPSRDEKQCPQCGEFVYREAKFCRFCGSPFSPAVRG